MKFWRNVIPIYYLNSKASILEAWENYLDDEEANRVMQLIAQKRRTCLAIFSTPLLLAIAFSVFWITDPFSSLNPPKPQKKVLLQPFSEATSQTKDSSKAFLTRRFKLKKPAHAGPPPTLVLYLPPVPEPSSGGIPERDGSKYKRQLTKHGQVEPKPDISSSVAEAENTLIPETAHHPVVDKDAPKILTEVEKSTPLPTSVSAAEETKPLVNPKSIQKDEIAATSSVADPGLTKQKRRKKSRNTKKELLLSGKNPRLK